VREKQGGSRRGRAGRGCRRRLHLSPHSLSLSLSLSLGDGKDGRTRGTNFT